MSKKSSHSDFVGIVSSTIVFAGIFAILIWLLLIQKGDFDECKKSESVFCPNILCNGNLDENQDLVLDKTKARPSNICFPYAFRLTTPEATNSPGETNFECNLPLSGKVYTPA